MKNVLILGGGSWGCGIASILLHNLIKDNDIFKNNESNNNLQKQLIELFNTKNHDLYNKISHQTTHYLNNIDKLKKDSGKIFIYSRSKIKEDKITELFLSVAKTFLLKPQYNINQFIELLVQKICIINDFECCIKSKIIFDITFVAIPLKSFEVFFVENKKSISLISHNLVVCSKGYVKSKLQNSFDYLQETFNNNLQIAILSGPNFAKEVLDKTPTITTVASNSNNLLQDVKGVIQNDYFKVQTTQDILGISMLGLCKNIIAIGYGLLIGYKDSNLDLFKSTNSKSMYFSFAIQETIKIIDIIGGDVLSMYLSAGVGDIFLTCTDLKSRNVSFGLNIANEILNNSNTKIKSQEIINKITTNNTVEGIDGILVLHKILEKYNIQSFLYEAIFNFLFTDYYSPDNYRKFVCDVLDLTN